MSMIRDISYWWNVERPRAKAKSIRLKAHRELAQAEAELTEIVRQDAMCKTFKFSSQLIETKGRIARLKKLIEQAEAYLKDE